MSEMRVIPLIQFGLGGVGQAVAARVLATEATLARRAGILLRYVALCDSRGAVIAPDGLDAAGLNDILTAKQAGVSLAGMPIGYRHDGLEDIVDLAGLPGAIVIDVTAAENTTGALQLALQRGYSAVLANKKPLAGPFALFETLTAGGRLRYEATVGAGVPVIAVLRQALLAVDDPVQRIEGCFSGTLGYLTTGLQAGESFSALVGQARQQGYTEPDPRDDLGGMDVARKALILARTLGWPLELADVSVAPLFPASLSQGAVADFMAALPALDEEYRRRVAVAHAEGSVLRYVARLTDQTAAVGLHSVPLDTPLGRLQGADNLIAFHTGIYHSTPLVLQGRGAGVHGTAAGVLADIIALTA